MGSRRSKEASEFCDEREASEEEVARRPTEASRSGEEREAGDGGGNGGTDAFSSDTGACGSQAESEVEAGR